MTTYILYKLSLIYKKILDKYNNISTIIDNFIKEISTMSWYVPGSGYDRGAQESCGFMTWQF